MVRSSVDLRTEIGFNCADAALRPAVRYRDDVAAAGDEAGLCQAFTRWLARYRCHGPSAAAEKVRPTAWMTAQPIERCCFVERPDGCDIKHCLFPARDHLIV